MAQVKGNEVLRQSAMMILIEKEKKARARGFVGRAR